MGYNGRKLEMETQETNYFSHLVKMQQIFYITMVEVGIIKGRDWIDFEKSRICRHFTVVAGKGERGD